MLKNKLKNRNGKEAAREEARAARTRGAEGCAGRHREQRWASPHRRPGPPAAAAAAAPCGSLCSRRRRRSACGSRLQGGRGRLGGDASWGRQANEWQAGKCGAAWGDPAHEGHVQGGRGSARHMGRRCCLPARLLRRALPKPAPSPATPLLLPHRSAAAACLPAARRGSAAAACRARCRACSARVPLSHGQHGSAG